MTIGFQNVNTLFARGHDDITGSDRMLRAIFTAAGGRQPATDIAVVAERGHRNRLADNECITWNLNLSPKGTEKGSE